ncbi:probably inactive leucine-rich repeat receptor-like protein kinase [Seminavis robusta]|uniref:Probably inactive leucine-rich repeat receptor-like protein kinase n=1 Tax=Seminavis robusta TaxID=568900 RepID=A0A9N8HWJ6_9STRA|nr:probably inactive leucine-rich repeat receptor-like protein kinase [Seminavis robusta]|eukprot:Sro2231_g320060.1 probably inactive leucine-rich repeat receptor-like protein kinase (869) ;mRNA; f:9871-12477
MRRSSDSGHNEDGPGGPFGPGDKTQRRKGSKPSRGNTALEANSTDNSLPHSPQPLGTQPLPHRHSRKGKQSKSNPSGIYSSTPRRMASSGKKGNLTTRSLDLDAFDSDSYDSSGSVEETATGNAQFLGVGARRSSAGAGRESHRGRGGAGRELRRGSSVGRGMEGRRGSAGSGKESSHGQSSSGSKARASRGGKLRRNNTGTGALTSRRRVSKSPIRRAHTSTNISRPTVGSSSKPLSKASAPFMRTSTGVATTSVHSKTSNVRKGETRSNASLLDSDSDLSDPDEDDKKPEPTRPPPISSRHASTSSVQSAARSTAHKAMVDSSLLMEPMRTNDTSGVSIEWDQQNPFDAPTLNKDFSLGVQTTDLVRQSTINLDQDGSARRRLTALEKENEGDGKKKPFFLERVARMWRGNKQKGSRLGSTALAGFGDKYKVDQSVNLMDPESAEKHFKFARRQSRRQSKTFSKESIAKLGGSMHSIFDFETPGLIERAESGRTPRRRKKSTYKPPPYLQDKTKSVVCGWSGFLLTLSVVGAGLLVFSLVCDGSLEGKSKVAVTTTASPTTLEPTMSPVASPMTTVTDSPVALATESPLTVTSSSIDNTTNNESTVPPKEETVQAQPPAAGISTPGKNVSAVGEPEPAVVARKSPAVAARKAPAEDHTPKLSMVRREIWHDLVGWISRHNISHHDDFSDPESSAYKALDWIVEYDQTLGMFSSESMDKLLEVYSLVVCYFAFHPEATVGDAQNPNATVGWINHGKQPICKWHGVDCDDAQRVVTLNMSHSGLTGTFPKEMVAMNHLNQLDLSHNSIAGELHEEWPDNWPIIKLIDLSDNLLEGAIPDTWNEQWISNDEMVIDLSQNEGLNPIEVEV